MTSDTGNKSNKSIKNIISRRAVCALVFLILLSVLSIYFYCIVKNAQSVQQNTILENANAYSNLMDERISVDLYNFIDMNVNPELESSSLDEFFYNNRSVMSENFSKIRNSAAECVEMAENLEGLILYRTSDNTLVSTLSDYHYLAKINPAYPYLMSVIAQVSGEKTSFVYSSDGSVLYYYPILRTTESEIASGQVNDCVIAILHKSDDFLGVNISPTSSMASFAVLKEGQVLSTEGYNALSQKLVASIAGLARSTSSIYTYTDGTLPDYYFYIIPSKVSELDYCYYEPALSGWPLIQSAFSVGKVLNLMLLLTAIVFFSFLFVFSAPAKSRIMPEPEIKAAAPAVSLMETTFGTLPNFSGIIIDYHGTDNPQSNSEVLDMFDQIVRDNLSFNKISYQVPPQQYADCLQYHVNYVNYNMRVLSDSLKMNLFNAVPEYCVNIYYSTAVSTYQEMERDILYMHQHMHYSLVLGYGIRISIQDLQTFEANTEILATNVTGTIKNYLQSGAYDDFYAYLKHYKDIATIYPHPYNFMKWYSHSERYRFMEEAFSTVKSFIQENSFEHPILHATCNSVLHTAPGFNNLCEYLISCVQDYQKEHSHVISDRNEQIMNTIYKFIDEDLAGANLSSIARKMQMTDSHLSRLFKKNTGSNFSEYLSEKRLEEAANLLMQDTKLKVADISELLGYGNPTYFLARFKAKYGVSPSVYRKSHIMEKADTSAKNT